MTATSVHHIVFVDLTGPEAERWTAPGVAADGAEIGLEYLGCVGFPHPELSGSVSFVGFQGRRPLPGPTGAEGTGFDGVPD